MESYRRILAYLILVLTPLVFAGCDGGGGGGAPAAVETETFRFFQGSIHAVDPADPANPLIVDSDKGTGEAVTIIHGTIDNKRVTDLHGRTVAYVKNGKLYKVSALKGATPAPVQLSNAVDVKNIDTFVPDFANHGNAQVVYLAAAPAPAEASAANSVYEYKMVKVGMSDTAVPIPAKEPLSPLYDQNGAISGWLAFDYDVENERDLLNLYDANFNYVKTVKDFTGHVSFVDFTLDDIFMNIDDDLYAYHVATGVLTQLTTDQKGVGEGTAKDGTNLYVVYGYDVVSGKENILKVPLANPTTATPLLPEPEEIGEDYLAFTDNRVVYYSSGAIKAVPKAGGAPATLASRITAWFYDVPFVAKGTIVYYNGSNEQGPTAVAVREDGTPLSETDAALWVGSSLPNTFEPAVSETPQYLVMATGWNDETGFAGGTLQSFDATSNGLVANLVTIPADIRWIEMFGQVGADILAYGYGSGETNWNEDILFMNLKTENSLVRVTNTPEIWEWPVPVFWYYWW